MKTAPVVLPSDDVFSDLITKVPAITLGFWAIKILATTLGETAGDTVSMTLNLGYLTGSAIFIAILIAFVFCQVRSSRFYPFLYWVTIIASTTAGTTMADFATRSLGIGYLGGSLLLLSCVLISLFIWYRQVGTINVNRIHEPRSEVFYWVTITFSQTLGTALGDWTSDLPNMGYLSAAGVFAGMIGVVISLHLFTKISKVWLFWIAFILTRPLGAAVGDFLDKPVADGGLALSRPIASVILAAAIVILIILMPQRAAREE